jgi:hypothetical protein
VCLGLLLLALVPSKWPWHFGALAAIGAVAVAAEFERLGRERNQHGRNLGRFALALIALTSVALYAWLGAGSLLLPLELQETDLTQVFNPASFVLVCMSVVALSYWMLSRRDVHVLDALVRSMVVVVPLAVVALTATLFIRDASVTAWSPARQNIETLTGRESCGIADQLGVGRDLVRDAARRRSGVLVEPSLLLFVPCVRPSKIEHGLIELPTAAVFATSYFAVRELDGPFSAVSDLYELDSVTSGSQRVDVVDVVDDVQGLTRLEVERIED